MQDQPNEQDRREPSGELRLDAGGFHVGDDVVVKVPDEDGAIRTYRARIIEVLGPRSRGDRGQGS